PEYGSAKIVAGINSEGLGSAAVSALVKVIAARFGCSSDLVLEILRKDLSPSPPEKQAPTEQDLLAEEWVTLTGLGVPETAPSQRYVSERTEWHAWAQRVTDDIRVGRLAPLIESLTIVHRLREVRALVGFERVDVGTATVRPGLSTSPGWLPALEVFG